MSASSHQAVVTGLGFVSSLGTCKAEVARSLRELRSGIALWPLAAELDLPVRLAGLVPGFDTHDTNPAAWRWPDDRDIDPAEVRAMPPHGVHALAAVGEALAEAGLGKESLADGRTGLFAASNGSPRMTFERLKGLEASGWRRAHPHGVVGTVAGSLNFHLAALLGIRGASCGFVSACASGAHALGFALDQIRLRRQQRMIVVGAEELTLESVMPFHAMGALSLSDDPSASRPFDRRRDGFVATGGAVAVVGEEAGLARARGARPLAGLAGWGQACDGYHCARPEPEGAALEAAMRRALDDAGFAPEAVDHVNAHAPSTPQGDRAEALALRRLFGRRSPAIASTKALGGHALSMAGLLEAALCALALSESVIPGQAHLEEPDEACEGLDLPAASRAAGFGAALNNSSGFGGANVCHLFTRT